MQTPLKHSGTLSVPGGTLHTVPHNPQFRGSTWSSTSHPSEGAILQSRYPGLHAAIEHASADEHAVRALGTLTSQGTQLAAPQPVAGSDVLTHCCAPFTKQAFSPAGHCPLSKEERSVASHAATTSTPTRL